MAYPYVGAGGSLGVNLDDTYNSEAEYGVFGFRPGSTIIGVNGYPYQFTQATADIAAGTAGAPATGVLAQQFYWKRGTSMGTATVNDTE